MNTPGDSIEDWETWLDLSSTPPIRSRSAAVRKYYLHGGRILSPETWPTSTGTRIYVAFDDGGAVYVGQTTRPLASRVRNHFGNQRTDRQQQKAGTWLFIVTAEFRDLHPRELGQQERSAADWLLPLRHRAGHRHPTVQVDYP